MNLSRSLCLSVLVTCFGCHAVDMSSYMVSMSSMPSWKWKSPFSKLRAQNSDEPFDASFDDEPEIRVETPLIGEYTQVSGLNLITLQGVGLVTGLAGTGGDPPPSPYRQQIIEEMQRRNISVGKYKALLRSPNTALVVVRAYLPPLVRKGDTFDVEVRLPEGSEATSLRGGWLMETILTEQAYVPGQGVLTGKILAKARGPVLLSGEQGEDDVITGTLQRGRVLGGAVSLTERDLMMNLRNDFRSVRTSKAIADQIGRRFHLYNKHGIREPAAEAKTDQKIDLKVLTRYKDNFPRYLQVIRSIPRRETRVARQVRMETLKDQLNHPPQSGKAAVLLEAIGSDAVPVLKTGLKNSSLEVRFHSAVALAYLGEADGVKALDEAVRKEPAFRAYAFAALAALEDLDAVIALRTLMSEQSPEIRYGAFRALSTMDENDPFLNRMHVDGYFNWYVLNTGNEPMVHLTNRKKGELVLFGANQQFQTPLFLRAGGNIFIHARPGSDTVTVSRVALGEGEQRETVSTRVADVVAAAVKFGANYPAIVEMFLQADRQHNLPGELAIDALPQAGRTYYRTDEGTPGVMAKRKVRVGNSMQQPNLFHADGNEIDDGQESNENKPATEDRGTASLIDVRTEKSTAETAGSKSSTTETSKPKSFRMNWKYPFPDLRFFKRSSDNNTTQEVPSGQSVEGRESRDESRE